MMGGWAWGGSGIGVFYMLLQLLFLIALVVGLVLVVRHFLSGGEEPSQRASVPRASRGLDILEERYAQGEIDRDEFLRRKEDLLGGGE